MVFRVLFASIAAAILIPTVGCQLSESSTSQLGWPESTTTGAAANLDLSRAASMTTRAQSGDQSENADPVNPAATEQVTSYLQSDVASQDGGALAQFDSGTTQDSRVPDFEPDFNLESKLDEESSANSNGIGLLSVLQTTLDFYPEIEEVMQEFDIAEGEFQTAQGSFDTKLKANSENTPVGFYETYRSQFGVEQPTFEGGSLFAGYRFGRGDIEPWYLERNTNAGGELKFGANWALLRGKQIDQRRVALWQANLKRNAVEPTVRQRLLAVFRDAEIAYWSWVAAGQIYNRSKQLLLVAKDRIKGIEERIAAEDLERIAKTDNDRSILSRQVKLIQSKAKLDQAAIKLSLYLRDSTGMPLIPDESMVPNFGDTNFEFSRLTEAFVADALSCRPEINLIDLDIRKIAIDIEKANNDLLPKLNAQVAASQDFGRPTSASAAASSSTQTLFVFFDEKDEFQIDAGLFLSQDLQRRKARGKIRSLCGKRRQLEVKRRLLEQKIEAEVRQNYQLTVAAREQVQAAKRAFELAQVLAGAARDRLNSGDVDLFEIILREQQELAAAIEYAIAQLNFFTNRANLNVSTGCDQYQMYDQLLNSR